MSNYKTVKGISEITVGAKLKINGKKVKVVEKGINGFYTDEKAMDCKDSNEGYFNTIDIGANIIKIKKSKYKKVKDIKSVNTGDKLKISGKKVEVVEKGTTGFYIDRKSQDWRGFEESYFNMDDITAGIIFKKVKHEKNWVNVKNVDDVSVGDKVKIGGVVTSVRSVDSQGFCTEDYTQDIVGRKVDFFYDGDFKNGFVKKFIVKIGDIKETIYHFRDGKRAFTTVFVEQDGVVKLGTALCSEKDNFCRKTGVRIAKENMLRTDWKFVPNKYETLQNIIFGLNGRNKKLAIMYNQR